MAHSYEVIFFDLDGTLFDLIACERETVRRLLVQADPTLDPVAIERFLASYASISPGHWAKGLAAGSSREEIVDGIFAAVCAQMEIDASYLASPAQLYWQLFGDVAVLEEGALATLAFVSDRYRLGVITNGYADTQRPRLHAAGIAYYFQAIAVSGELGWAKPDPRIFIHALEQMDVAPSAALYVGDSLSHDQAGALEAGLDFCLYRPQGGDGLSLPPKVRLLSSLSQLAGLLA